MPCQCSYEHFLLVSLEDCKHSQCFLRPWRLTGISMEQNKLRFASVISVPTQGKDSSIGTKSQTENETLFLQIP